MRLTVYPPDGRVKITAPFGTDNGTINKFAVSKIAWIEKYRQRFMNQSKLICTLKNHSPVYVWGEALELEIIERDGNSKISVSGGNMTMYVRPGSSKAKKQELLDKWYRRSLKEAAPEVIKNWETRLGLEVKKIFVRKMKTHWGSCNHERQTLRLNSELAKRDPEYMEYVIVHEMLHIVEKGHNKKFYRLLGKYLPEWKKIRKKLNSAL